MADLHTRVGGAWKKANKIHVRVGGAWKEVKKGYVRVGGAWKEFFTSLSLRLTTVALEVLDGGGSMSFTVKRDGVLSTSDMSGTQNRTNEWVEDGREATVGDAFEAQLTKSFGDDPDSGPALSTWHTISSDRTWSWNNGRFFTGTLTIRDVATAGSEHQVSADVTASTSIP
jgi:hypothetical protein